MIFRLVLFFVMSAIVGIVDPPTQGTGRLETDAIPLLIGMITMLLGMIIAWFREKLGGLLTVGGFVFFVIVELITRRQFGTWSLLVFLAVGLLHLFCWQQTKKLSQS